MSKRNKNAMKVLFFYYGPHYAHAEMAKVLHADFYPAPKLRSESRNTVVVGLGIAKSVLTLPKNYEVYFCEGTYVIPALARKLGLLNKNAKIVNILGDFLLYSIKTNRIKGIRKKFALWLLKEVDLFIAVSKMENELLKEFLPNAKSIVMYPKPKKEVIKILIKDTKLPDLDSHKILTIGSGSTYNKGIDIVYKAFKLVKKEFPDAELFIVGNIPDLPKYINYNEGGVHCLGYVENLKKVIKNSALYVHMGRGDAFPLSSIEAMLGGLPAIVSKWTGTKEVIKMIDNRLVVNLNFKELANKIIWYFKLGNSKRVSLSIKSKKIAKNFIDGIKIDNLKNKIEQMIK